MKKFTALICTVLLCAAIVYADSFSSNRFQLMSRIYTEKAEKAYENGQYDLSIEYTKKAEEYAEQSRAYIQKMLERADADKQIRTAMNLIARARAVKADESSPDIFTAGLNATEQAKEIYTQEDYIASSAQAKEAQDILRQLNLEENPKQPVIAQGDEITFPKYYVVRPWLSDKDCLWNISERPYVYADPWQWKKLYDANKSMFPDPDNPNLIIKDMILEIPPLANEKREGTFDPTKEYASIQR